MYKKILVPLDGSELAECVLPHVESIVKGCQAPEVVFVRTVEPFYIPAGDFGFDEKEIKKIDGRNKVEAESYLSDVMRRARLESAKASSKVLFGRAADSLVDFASKSGADLVVIATHGRSGVSRWVFGSVADRLLRSVCTPVFMVRAPGCIPGM